MAPGYSSWNEVRGANGMPRQNIAARPRRRTGSTRRPDRAAFVTMPNRLAGETSPYLLQHAHNPVDWYPWGEEALRARAARGQADPAQHRLRGVPLVPRHGARVVRGRGDRGADERALRVHQGGPRGAARPRRHLHAGDAGDDGPRRLADDGVPHARGRAVLRAARTSRPTTGTGMPRFRRVLAAVADAWHEPARAGRAHHGVDARAVRGEQPSARARRARSTETLLDARRRDAAQQLRRRGTAASAARRSFRRRWRSTSLLRHWARTGNAERAARWCSTRSGAWRAAGSTIRSAAASRATPWTRLARAALREDAVRQRAARPARRAPLAGDARRRGAARHRGDDRLGSRAR